MKVLVLGAAGMMGHMAVRVLSESFDTYGAVRSSTPPARLRGVIADDHFVTGVDAFQSSSLVRAFAVAKPDVVLNCVGIVKQLDAAHDPIMSTLCNSLLPHQLADLCDATSAHLLHLSTDCVFSGEKGNYGLDDNPDPVDLYGRTKLVGEVAAPHATTFRTSIVGRQLLGTTGLFEWAMSQRGRQVSGFQGAIYTGLTTEALCRIIAGFLAADGLPGGLWQVASEPITKYDLLVQLNQKLGLDLDILVNHEFHCDRSLDGSAFVDMTGVEIPSWDEMLTQFAADGDFYTQRQG